VINDLRRILRGAVDQAKLGYEFSPSSYSYRAMNACMAAEAALAVLAEAIQTDHGDTHDVINSTWAG